MKLTRFLTKSTVVLTVVLPVLSAPIFAKPSSDKQRVIDYWTAERMANAQPRDLRKDRKTGYGYRRNKDGSFVPHGHNKLLQLSGSKAPNAKPGGGGGGNQDSTPPEVNHIEPADGATIGASQRFAANVTDAGGVRSATLIINLPSGGNQTFAMSNSAGDVWETDLSGFTDGSGWSWQVEAADNGKRGGNKTTSSPSSFTVDTGSGGGGGGGGGSGDDAIANDRWTNGGVIQNAAGRLFYEMPTNSRLKRWAGYVCSGTVTTDATSGRSVVITAAHCVYDDTNKAFARNVLFIPNQDQTSGSGTDSNCGNDPLGCWVMDFGVVDVNWTTTSFPNNIPYDYAYYVVSDTGAHQGTSAGTDVLDAAVTPLSVDFSTPNHSSGSSAADSDYTHGLGYSYADDPNFMYCADNMTTEGPDNWWIPICGLSGGSSGGPWVQPMGANGSGPLISVNSWGYTDGSPGMAGPFLNGNTAQCLFGEAKSIAFSSIPSNDGRQGVAVDYCN